MFATLPSGTVLKDRYRVVELVGAGGGGAVYRAEDLRLTGRVTAIKEIRPEPGATEELRTAAQEQFRREAHTLARLDHPALPKVSDYFAVDGTDYLVMDYVDGPDLRQVVTEARTAGNHLDEASVLGWAGQLLDVLAFLHGQEPPVLHRDIKPANIKLVDGSRIKLVDFGLVKPLDPTDPRTLTVARGVGSLPYTPLEQYAGDTGHTDPRSDLYSVGATLYHLLTGVPPATAQDRFLSPRALQRPRQLNPQLSGEVEAVVLAAMALHPDRRPPDARTMLEQLRGQARPPAPTERVDAPSTASLGHTVADNAGLLALVGLLLLLAVLATYQSQQRAETAPSGTSVTPTELRTRPVPTMLP